MKLGIMGTGKIVQEVLPTIVLLRPEKCFLMGRDHSVARTKKLCEQYDLDGYFLCAEELLAADIDTVYLALPNQLHVSFAKQAMEAGKHVIVEKPIAISPCELEEMETLARVQNVFLFEAMSVHYLPAFLSLKEQLPRIGEIQSVTFRFLQYSSRYDDFLAGRVAPAFDTSCLGGALTDLNVYNLHAIVALFGEPQTAKYSPHMQQEIDTSGVVTLGYKRFRAEAIAAKDRCAMASSVLCGERGEVRIPMPVNGMDCYEICDNQGRREHFDFYTKEHRMAHAFREFEQIIRCKDRIREEKLLRPSQIVAGLIDHLLPYPKPE